MSLPSDFLLIINSRGDTPFSPKKEIEIHSNGKCLHRFQEDQVDSTVEEEKFEIKTENLEKIYERLLAINFFELDSHEAEDIDDGDEIQISLKADRKENTILLKNFPLKPVDGFIKFLNEFVPEQYQLVYNSLVLGET